MLPIFLQTATELSVFPYSDHRVLICTMRNDNQGAEHGKSFFKIECICFKGSQGFLAFMRFKLVNNVNENWSSENTNDMKIGPIAFCSLLLLNVI